MHAEEKHTESLLLLKLHNSALEEQNLQRGSSCSEALRRYIITQSGPR